MQLKDILDMHDYLANRCYCPGEIYDESGFFCKIFDDKTKCALIGERKDDVHNFVAVVAEHENSAQILIIWRDDDCKSIVDAVRYDATEHNIRLVKDIIAKKVDKGKFDEYDPHSTRKSLKNLMNIVEADEGRSME